MLPKNPAVFLGGISRPTASFLFLLAVWIILIAWMPFVFEFYYDDWASVALPLDRYGDLKTLLEQDPARPLYEASLYFLRPILNPYSELWHFLLALIHFFSAIAIASTASFLFTNNRKDGEVLGSAAGVLWMAFPWSLGYCAWPIMLPPNLAMLFTVLAFWILVRPQLNMSKVNFSVLMLTASWLIYEATWMFWLPLSLVLFVRAISRQESTRYAIQFTVRAMALQLLFIAWNRFVSGTSAHAKTLSADLVAAMDVNVRLLSSQLLPSIEALKILGFAMLLCLPCLIMNRKQWIKTPSIWSVPIFMLFGLLLSTVIYAVGGVVQHSMDRSI